MADAPYTAWDDTDASNTAIDGHDISENCIPNGLNNAMRAWRGSLARLFHSLTGQKVTAGTADAQTLTTGLSLSGMPEAIVGFTAGASLTNTGACTLAVDSMGVVSVKVPDGAGALACPLRPDDLTRWSTEETPDGQVTVAIVVRNYAYPPLQRKGSDDERIWRT